MTDITLTRSSICLSIVICTYNEAESIESVITQIHSALPQSQRNEIIIVDDSTDETPSIVNSLSNSLGIVRLLHRSKDRRDGLGGAILTGIKAARGKYVLVMDGDGQHPPEIISALFKAAEQGNDFVLPSRYISDGSNHGLSSPLRTFYSWSLRMLPRWLFVQQIGKITDPLSGYFLFKRDIVDIQSIQTNSWKVLLELLLFSTWKTYTEVPYTFQKRHGGESKASIRVGIDYITQLLSLVKRFYFVPQNQLKFQGSFSIEGDNQ